MKDKSRKRRKAIQEEDHETANNVPKSKKKKSAVAEHKETLEQLQKTDPKFYEFLKEQDAELLDFDVSDAEEGNEEGEDNGAEDSDEEQEVQEPEDAEKIYMDEDKEQYSDDEQETGEGDDEVTAAKIPVTSRLVREWQKQLSKLVKSTKIPDARKLSNLLEHIVDAFRAVVLQAGAKPDKRGQYRIDDSVGFNSAVRLCFSAFPTIWKKLVGDDITAASQGRHRRLRPYAKPYLHNLIEFLQEIQNADVLDAVLKHVTHVADYYSLFGTLSHRIIKVLLKIWSTKDESARILAFVSIMKLVRASPDPLGAVVLKKMYLAYVQNTKLVTPNSWPLISFMQRSYAELCGFDKQLSYQHAFIYIRQLAIHLRNAITTKKKEQIMAVYNWQFIQCLYLWARVLSTHAKEEVLRPLVYPLIQVALGCSRLIPTAKYFPLRFHCIRAILIVAQEAGVCVPVLPIILEVFQQADFKKKHQRQSLKPLDFDCLLKLSQSQLQESAFKIGLVEAALELVVEAMRTYVGSVAFPEMAFICCNRLKSFTKSCHIAALSRPVKELSDKISEHAIWVDERRATSALNLADGSVDAFETDMNNAIDSPLRKYFETFKAMKERQRKLKLETAVDEQEEEDADVKMRRQRVSGVKEPKRPKDRMKQVKKAKKKQQKTEHKVLDDDVVQDLNLSDFDE